MSELNDYTVETLAVSEIIELFDCTGTEGWSEHGFEYAVVYES